MIRENRHVLPLTIIALALIAAISAMVLTDHTVPAVFEDALIGCAFAIGGLTQIPR